MVSQELFAYPSGTIITYNEEKNELVLPRGKSVPVSIDKSFPIIKDSSSIKHTVSHREVHDLASQKTEKFRVIEAVVPCTFTFKNAVYVFEMIAPIAPKVSVPLEVVVESPLIEKEAYESPFANSNTPSGMSILFRRVVPKHNFLTNVDENEDYYVQNGNVYDVGSTITITEYGVQKEPVFSTALDPTFYDTSAVKVDLIGRHLNNGTENHIYRIKISKSGIATVQEVIDKFDLHIYKRFDVKLGNHVASEFVNEMDNVVIPYLTTELIESLVHYIKDINVLKWLHGAGLITEKVARKMLGTFLMLDNIALATYVESVFSPDVNPSTVRYLFEINSAEPLKFLERKMSGRIPLDEAVKTILSSHDRCIIIPDGPQVLDPQIVAKQIKKIVDWLKEYMIKYKITLECPLDAISEWTPDPIVPIYQDFIEFLKSHNHSP